VAVLEDAGETIGFFPFENRGLGYGVPIAPGLTDCQGVMQAPDADWDAGELLRSCRLGVWEFDRLVDGQKPFEPYQVIRAPAPVIDLSGGSAAVLADLRRRHSRVASKLPKQQRRLEREVGPLRFEFGTTDHAALQTLMAWKSGQYRRTGRSDRFARPWITRLIENLFDLRAREFSLVLSVLHAGEHPVAAHLALRQRGVMAGWFPAYDPQFARYSPGLLHRLHLIQAAADDGVTLIELGRGAREHKDLFKSYEVLVGEGKVSRPSAGAALYFAGRAPLRRLRATVMESPRLYRTADAVLRHGARIHTTLSSRSGRGTPGGRS
jgi:CelD/BcsL family acetyltransferase involved in cellulose biosynthesis